MEISQNQFLPKKSNQFENQGKKEFKKKRKEKKKKRVQCDKAVKLPKTLTG